MRQAQSCDHEALTVPSEAGNLMISQLPTKSPETPTFSDINQLEYLKRQKVFGFIHFTPLDLCQNQITPIEERSEIFDLDWRYERRNNVVMVKHIE
jgi:hypothetical protein